MAALYEWRDDTDLGHPSLVYLDVTDVAQIAGVESELDLEFEDILRLASIIKVKQIDSFNDVFDGGRLNRRKVKARGMEFVWHYRAMNSQYYALFVAFERKKEIGGDDEHDEHDESPNDLL